MKALTPWLPLAISPLMLAACALGAEFEFVVIGDTRPRFESESFRQFELLIPKINALKPTFVINLGDLIYGYGFPSKERQWDKYESVIKAIEPRYYQLPGNHDTHSKAARRIYGRRFGKFYESFDHADCHFVLLDNTEDERWGYVGPTQFEWLKQDLKETRANSVFILMHFPVWEPERVTPEYYDFWDKRLHPLFKDSRVKAVFAGHYHSYGPTREFDGIRYFVTGGGGAELRPEYRKSGGDYHFMRLKVSGQTLHVGVVTEHGEISDPEADVMGGLQFAAYNVSRIGIKRGEQDWSVGATFKVSVKNPYVNTLLGDAKWVFDSAAFAVAPEQVVLNVPRGSSREYAFTLKALETTAIISSLPRLQFSVASGGYVHRFHREIRFLEQTRTPFRAKGPDLDGRLEDWAGVVTLQLAEAPKPPAELSTCYDRKNLYVALKIPAPDTAEAKELGFEDEVQIGLAKPSTRTEFGSDLLRLGIDSASEQVHDRTPGHKRESTVPGVKSVCLTERGWKTYEAMIPLRLLKGILGPRDRRIVIDLSFPAPEQTSATSGSTTPAANTISYRVRYGADSLVPVYFVELNLAAKR